MRYINDYWKIRFIVHEIGDRNYCPIYDYRITGSMYGERIGDIEDDKAIRSFYGNDYEALILTSEGQCGAVCDEDEVDLE